MAVGQRLERKHRAKCQSAEGPFQVDLASVPVPVPLPPVTSVYPWGHLLLEVSLESALCSLYSWLFSS